MLGINFKYKFSIFLIISNNLLKLKKEIKEIL